MIRTQNCASFCGGQTAQCSITGFSVFTF